MNQLPVETLHQIFSLLFQNEKVECMLVCRRFAHLIKSRSLYNTLHFGDMQILNSTIKSLQQAPIHHKSQVESLILNLYLEENFDPSILLTTFPNLQSIYLLGSDHKHFQRKVTADLQERHFQYIAETLSHTLTMGILSTSLCPRLKTLSVNATELGIPSRLLISLLTNAPNLKEISMSAFGVSFDDMELLHATLPLLHSVELGCTLLMDRRLPANILPATHIRTFTLEAPDSTVGVQTQWLRYIRLKYTNLHKYGFGNPFSWPSDGHHVERLQRQELTPVIKGFGSKLKTLQLRLKKYDLNLFQVLDEGDCRLDNVKMYLRTQDFSILDALARSNQAKYIHTLRLNLLELKSDCFGWLRELTALNRLTLECNFKTTSVLENTGSSREGDREKIQLCNLLDCSSDTLKSLSISNAQLCISSGHERVYSLSELDLTMVKVPETMDQFIVQSFPSLRALKLSFCGLNGRSFNLTGLHLSVVEISEGIVFKNTHILVVSDKEKRWYTAEQSLRTRSFCKRYIDEGDSVVYPASRSVPFDRWKGPKGMVFTCASVNKLIILSP
ncbi:hypothetical protein K501DRAFT_265973 [Backusella circina FSU 941]|nr:hypothetical protein K501DRAFT_265973 [Backusella circina FSU 941]